MRTFGINRQWSKKDAVIPLLPESVVEECKPILRLTEDEAGDTIYKDLKEEILTLYGPRDEDVFKKALALRLTTTPSALGKKLIHLICPGSKPFVGCHCAKMVYGFWDAQLTPQIRSALAEKKFTEHTYKDIFKHADKVFLANGGSVHPNTVVAATSVSDDSNPAAPQVAAVRGGGRGTFRGQSNRGQNRGRGNRGNRGGGGRGAYNNNSNQNQDTSSTTSGQKPHQKGPKASPDVPSDACSRHWKDGKAATYCSDPLNCSWVKFIAPRRA